MKTWKPDLHADCKKKMLKISERLDVVSSAGRH